MGVRLFAMTCGWLVAPLGAFLEGERGRRIALARRPIVLAALAYYLRRSLEALRLPPMVHDRELMLESLKRLRGLERAGARIVHGHDPELRVGIPQAPLEML